MKRIACLETLAALGVVAACTGSVSLGQVAPSDGGAGGATDATSGDGSVGGPYGVSCALYRRVSPTADFEQQTFTTRSDAPKAQTFTFPDATIDVALAPAADVATEALLTVSVREKYTTHTYRLTKDHAPVDQFAGGHGFTGLVYVGDNIQYICDAENAPAPAILPYVVPVDVVCQVEERDGTGGAVLKSQVFEFIPRVDGSDPPKTETFTYEGGFVDITVADQAFESHRAITTRIGNGGSSATGGPSTTVSQLFQLNRSAALVNQLAGTTFTGRIAFNTAFFQNNTSHEVSYACSAREGGGVTGFDPSDSGVTEDGASLNPIGSLKPCGFTSGTPSCGQCDSLEFCFTQVSCSGGSAGTCTIGSANFADNRCHKSCQKDEQCGSNGECIMTLPFFGCADFDTPGPGRGFCCTKGTNCQ